MPNIESTIMNLIDMLASAHDAEIQAAAAKLNQLRANTAGTDRETVCWALVECRELLSPAGRLKRAVNLAVQQGGGADIRK